MASNSMTDTETTTTETDPAKVDTPATEAAATGSADDTTTTTAASDTSADTAEKPAGETTGESPAAGTAPTSTTGSGSFVTGALALVAAGLGLASLTGTSLGDMMRARQELLGQITAATGGQIDQIEALYGSPWHTVALVNATMAVLAVIVGAVLLAVRGRSAGTPNWVKAVALGGTVLGVIGLLVSGGMYLDLFAAAPQLPSMPGLGG
ncbi:hypothetical protein [Pseudonocardia sp. KRD291]|uniref:hypothetical protein n=1 Tax=Pseudonocardia sp. KRD291 TaxID=2792007 RepID=UPI001C49FCDE|nr:hypothetical protein [Pseudonocardia sp. KRD291]MBW0101606.1 hypothetical protein [Pseudonocardia sp. KRD291]